MSVYYVEIVDDETGEVVKRMGPMNERKAERVENGANINMDHNRYYTRIAGGGEDERGEGEGTND